MSSVAPPPPAPTSALPAPDEHAGRRAPVTVANAVLLVAVVALTLALAWYWRWTADDAFINFRAVRNVLDGNGPVFNSGERIEVGTSPLWLWLLAGLAAVLPFDVGWIAVGLGALGSAAGVAFAARGAAALNRPAAAPPGAAVLLLPAGVLVFLALPATWAFLTSGLETGLSFAWLGTVWYGAARQAAAAHPTRPWWLLVLLGLGPLVRPDLALVGGLLGLWLLLAVRSSWGRRIRDIAVAAAVPVAYQVFRMGWFGLLVPNTAVAKESSRSVWARGWSYLADLVVPYHLHLAGAVAVALLLVSWRSARWDRRAGSLVAVTVLAAVLQGLFVIRVGGDFMHGRLLLPALFLALCPIAVVGVAPRGAARRWPVLLGVAGLVAWSLASASTWRIDYEGRIGDAGFADERGVYVTAAGTPNPVTLQDHRGNDALALGAQVNRAQETGADLVYSQTATASTDPSRLVPLGRTTGGTSFLLYQAGYLGYAADPEVLVLDYYGLTDAVAAHLEPQPAGRAGHEKVMPIIWFWARHGEGSLRQPLAGPLGGVTPLGLAAAQDALRCGDLADLVAATSGPMTWDRFRDNLTGAVDRTSLRIPSDPRQARALFC